MGKKRKQPEHESHERWLVSYADFITLLFAFFVVMFASSQSDKAKAAQVSKAVRDALEGDKVSAAISAVFSGTGHDKGKGSGTKKSQPTPQKPAAPIAVLADLAPSLTFLTAELKREIARGEMQVSLEPRGLVVSLKQAAFFPSGEDTIDPATIPSLEKVAAAIRKLPNPVRLEGHTDAIPIHNSRFRSNWELSTARSIAMLVLFTTRLGISEDRLAVAGYADTVPIAPNDTEEGRARNRRVDIVVLNQAGLSSEPHRR